jgi:hypothetical protein
LKSKPKSGKAWTASLALLAAFILLVGCFTLQMEQYFYPKLRWISARLGCHVPKDSIPWRVQLLLSNTRINNGAMHPVSMQRIGKYVPAAMNKHTIELLLETVFSTRSVLSGYKEDNWGDPVIYTPCGGGVEYLHRDPASRRRRRKGKSRIWDSKIWPWVLRDSDPKMTALARTSSNCKRQTHPLVREGAPNQQTRNC